MMPTLAQHVDADRLIQAIRQDPIPSHAASLAVAAVEAALQAYRPPSLEARRLAEEAAGAVTASLAVLSACVLTMPPPRRPPPAPRPPAPPPQFAPSRPPVDVLALVPLACALAALPMQSGAVGSLLVLATAAGSSMVLLRNFHRPPVPATLPPPPPPPAAPILPDAPTASLQPEAIAAAVRRALEQIDDLVAFSERRRVARTDLSTLNDTTLEFLQDLAEAALRSRAEFALAKIEFRLPVVLEACDLQSVEYGPATAEHFDIDGDPAQATTRRPALLAGGRCVKRGLAATRPGRAA